MMTAPPADLDLDRLLATAQDAALNARLCQSLAIRSGDEEARRYAEAAAEASSDVARRLTIAGANAPKERNLSAAPSDAFSLSALASLAGKDTPAARSMLAALRDILPTAEALDRERGAWYENAPPSDTKGTDFAESVHHLICRLELELTGPRSRGGE